MVRLPLSDVAGKRFFVSTPLPALVMGIVNCTPDSFWQESRGSSHQAAELALQLAEEGADIIDVGAESTRPGSNYIEEGEELRRLIPVIEEIRRHSSIPLSVDTRKKVVMEAAWQAGANILNDISALEDDMALGAFAAAQGISVVLMHKRGIPTTMQRTASYGDAFSEVDTYLRHRVELALSLGLHSDRIWIDPGIGFGKDFEANRGLVEQCGRLCGGRYPVVMGLSRKTFVAQMIACQRVVTKTSGTGLSGSVSGEDLPAPHQRLAGTIAANMIAVSKGATVLRVHDVAATRDMLSVYGSLKRECSVNSK